MKIQVLGSGCPTCHKLFDLVTKAAKELNLKDEVAYVYGPEGVQKIIEMGVMSSPVVAIDDKPVVVGFLPDIEKIKKIIVEKSSSKDKPVRCSCGGNC